MGIVYKVRDGETGEIVALKLLKPEIASDPKMREELRKEVCLARKVTHKNVCRIHELDCSDQPLRASRWSLCWGAADSASRLCCTCALS